MMTTTSYRLLNVGETIQDGDDVFTQGAWKPAVGDYGETVTDWCSPFRRAVAPSPVVMPEDVEEALAWVDEDIAADERAAEAGRREPHPLLNGQKRARTLARYIRSLSSPAPVEGEVWQTMESAPKDGTEILGYYGITYPDLTRPPWDKDCMVISWCDDAFKGNKAWRNNGGGAMIEPKLWMRLDSLRASALSRLEREAKGGE